MMTGMTRPDCACVRALNCLQNSMMLMPCWPSAGPTGGAGVAAPALHCSLTMAVIGFAISGLLEPLDRLDLEEVQLHRGRAAEDADHHLHLAALVVDFVHHARERTERTVADPHVVADVELHRRHRARLARFHLAQQAPDLVLLERDLAAARAHEPRDAGHVLHQVARLVVEQHLDDHVGGERLPLRGLPLAVLHLHDFLGHDEDLPELLREPGRVDGLLEVRLDLVLMTRVGVDHVPLLVAHACFRHRPGRPALGPSLRWVSRVPRVGVWREGGLDQRKINATARLRIWSTTPMNAATSNTVAITTIVESRSSSRVGQLTLRSSTPTSFVYSRIRSIADIVYLGFSCAGPVLETGAPRPGDLVLAGQTGLEPATPGFGDRCSAN